MMILDLLSHEHLYLIKVFTQTLQRILKHEAEPTKHLREINKSR